MFQYRKWAVLFLAAAWGLFIGCKKESSRETVLTWAVAKGPAGTHRELIRLFETNHPDIKIRLMEMPQNTGTQHDAYVTYLAAQDSTIDIYTLDIIWPAEFASAEWVLPLDSYFPPPERKKFLGGPIQGCTYENKIFAVPWFTDAGLLYYRKDLLDKENLSPPADRQEFLRQAKLLSRKYGIHGYLFQGQQYEGLICNFLEWVWGNGGSLFDEEGRGVIDRPESVEALEWMVDLIHRHRVSPESVLTYKEEESRQMFTEGKAVFLRNWPYVWRLAQDPESGSKIAGKVGVTGIPGKEGKSASTLGGWNLAISRFSKHPDKAWKIIRFLTGEEAQKILAIEGGLLPTRKKLYRDKEILSFAPHYSEYYPVFAQARPRPAGPSYPSITDRLQIAVHQALTQDADPKTALREAAREIRRLSKRQGIALVSETTEE